MKGKRGISELAKNIGEIVLVIIGLFLLFYLLFVLIDAAFVKQSKLQATGTLGDVYDKINALENDASDTYYLQSPLGWKLASFRGDKEYGGIHKDCIKKNCLCLCKGIGFFGFDCQKEALCDVISKPALSENGGDVGIKISTMRKIEIKNLKDNYEIKEAKE